MGCYRLAAPCNQHVTGQASVGCVSAGLITQPPFLPHSQHLACDLPQWHMGGHEGCGIGRRACRPAARMHYGRTEVMSAICGRKELLRTATGGRGAGAPPWPLPPWELPPLADGRRGAGAEGMGPAAPAAMAAADTLAKPCVSSAVLCRQFPHPRLATCCLLRRPIGRKLRFPRPEAVSEAGAATRLLWQAGMAAARYRGVPAALLANTYLWGAGGWGQGCAANTQVWPQVCQQRSLAPTGTHRHW